MKRQISAASLLLPVQPTELGSLSFDLMDYRVDMRVIFIQDGNVLGGGGDVSKLTVEEITAP